MSSMGKRTRAPEPSVCVFSMEGGREPLYRYSLEHRWDDDIPSYARTTIAWLLLNPSTADQSSLDPTLRRCKTFSKSWGYGGMVILNCFAFRATLPKDMMAVEDPIGPDNDRCIEKTLAREDVKVVVAGWGKHGAHRGRAQYLMGLYPGRLSALKVNKDGTPRHPLYIPGNLTPQPYGFNPPIVPVSTPS